MRVAALPIGVADAVHIVYPLLGALLPLLLSLHWGFSEIRGTLLGFRFSGNPTIWVGYPTIEGSSYKGSIVGGLLLL